MLTRGGEPSVYLSLSVGVVAVSFATIFIRLADAPALTIAAYRMAISAPVMLALAGGQSLRSGGGLLPGLNLKDLPLVGFSSLCLATHFWVWTISLEHTSVASSVVLVTTSPFMVAVASRIIWGEALPRHTMVGIAVGMVGGAVLALGDLNREGDLFGDAMAFLGGTAVVGYILAGRGLRARMPALTYNTTVYAGTAALLLIAAVATGAPFSGFTAGTYAMLLLVALVPQVIGHSLLNWSLAHVTATAVAISVMAEPVLTTAAAIPILREVPPATSVAGGALVLAGIYAAMRPRGREQRD